MSKLSITLRPSRLAALRRYAMLAVVVAACGTALIAAGCRAKGGNRADIERQNTLKMIEETHRHNPPDVEIK